MSLDRVRTAYDSVAGLYADMFADAGLLHPDDRALLQRWLVGRTGRVLDLGCGPGHLTAHLAAAGVDVAGADPVEAFVAIARSRFPGVAYEVGSFDTVAAADLDGVLSWYSTIHTPPDRIDATLARLRSTAGPWRRPRARLLRPHRRRAGAVRPQGHHRLPVAHSRAGTPGRGRPLLRGHTETRPERPERRHGAIVALAV